MNPVLLPANDFLRLIVLDRTGGVPLHLQLRNSLRRIILESFQVDDKMPAEELIADRLGVSRATVRRALTDLTNDGLLERRRASGTRVIKSAASAKLSNVAVVMPDFDTYSLSMDSSFLGAIDRKRRDLGADLRMLRFKNGDEWESFERLMPFSPAEGGVILLGTPAQATEDLYGILGQRGYPVVSIDVSYPGCSGSSVRVSDRAAIELGLEHLYKLGHRNICLLVGEPEEVYAVRERCRFFKETAEKLGLDAAEVVHGGSRYWENSSQATVNVMPQLWKKSIRPTAIFAVSDYTAFGCLSWLQRNGVRVPEEVSLLSFDGTQLCRMVTPRLTTLVQPVDLIAREAFRLLESPQGKPEQIQLPPTLRDGDSVRFIG
jgi:LacI family transcriptional regulator